MEQATVIVIDDSDEVRDLMTIALEDEGYRVLPVEDGETALTMMHHIRPALVTLDLGLPRANGTEILRRIKSEPELASIPVLVISGNENAHQMGSLADEVLVKPFDINRMQAAVSRLVARAGTRPPS